MRINTDDDGVFEADASVQEIRDFFDGKDLPTEVTDRLDEAQGHAFSGNGDAILIIHIKK